MGEVCIRALLILAVLYIQPLFTLTQKFDSFNHDLIEVSIEGHSHSSTVRSVQTDVGFTVEPQSQTQPEGLPVVFECKHPEAYILWSLNGTVLEEGNPPDGVKFNQTHLVIFASSHYNNTEVTCHAVASGSDVIGTRSAFLVIYRMEIEKIQALTSSRFLLFLRDWNIASPLEYCVRFSVSHGNMKEKCDFNESVAQIDIEGIGFCDFLTFIAVPHGLKEDGSPLIGTASEPFQFYSIPHQASLSRDNVTITDNNSTKQLKFDLQDAFPSCFVPENATLIEGINGLSIVCTLSVDLHTVFCPLEDDLLNSGEVVLTIQNINGSTITYNSIQVPRNPMDKPYVLYIIVVAVLLAMCAPFGGAVTTCMMWCFKKKEEDNSIGLSNLDVSGRSDSEPEDYDSGVNFRNSRPATHLPQLQTLRESNVSSSPPPQNGGSNDPRNFNVQVEQ